MSTTVPDRLQVQPNRRTFPRLVAKERRPFPPISVPYAKAQIGIGASNSRWDDNVERLVDAVADTFEHAAGVSLAGRAFEWYPEDFPRGNGGLLVPIRNPTTLTKFDVEAEDKLSEVLLDITRTSPVIWKIDRGAWWDLDPDALRLVHVELTAGPATEDDIPAAWVDIIVSSVQRRFDDGGLADTGDDPLGPAWRAEIKRIATKWIG